MDASVRIGMVAMLALALSACGSKTDGEAAAKRLADTASAQALGSDDVAAVLESAGQPVAKVRFVIGSRPLAGQPFNVKVMVAAVAPVTQLLVSVQSEDLAVDPATATMALAETEKGGGETSGSQNFSVTARQDGLFELAVHLTADTAGPETLYVIPVLVTKPGAAAPAPASDKPDPAAAGDHAQPKKG